VRAATLKDAIVGAAESAFRARRAMEAGEEPHFDGAGPAARHFVAVLSGALTLHESEVAAAVWRVISDTEL
jgi:hypothetical protein